MRARRSSGRSSRTARRRVPEPGGKAALRAALVFLAALVVEALAKSKLPVRWTTCPSRQRGQILKDAQLLKSKPMAAVPSPPANTRGLENI